MTISLVSVYLRHSLVYILRWCNISLSICKIPIAEANFSMRKLSHWIPDRLFYHLFFFSGMYYARQHMKVIFSTIIRKFKLSSKQKFEDFIYESHLMPEIENLKPIQVEERVYRWNKSISSNLYKLNLVYVFF